MQEFWGASKAFFTEKWAYIYYNFGHENFFVTYFVGKFTFSLALKHTLFFSSLSFFFSSGTTLYGYVVYILVNVFFSIVDLTGKPAFLKKYKIQEDKNFPVSKL